MIISKGAPGQPFYWILELALYTVRAYPQIYLFAAFFLFFFLLFKPESSIAGGQPQGCEGSCLLECCL